MSWTPAQSRRGPSTACGCGFSPPVSNETRKHKSFPRPSTTRASTGAVNASKGLWISTRELARLPRSGAAWSFVKQTADQRLGRADIADQNNLHGVRTYAVAL